MKENENLEIEISKFVNETILKLVELQAKYEKEDVRGETFSAAVASIIVNFKDIVSESKRADKYTKNLDDFLDDSGIYNILEKVETFGV